MEKATISWNDTNAQKKKKKEFTSSVSSKARFGRKLFLIWTSVKINLHITSVIKLMDSDGDLFTVEERVQ